MILIIPLCYKGQIMMILWSFYGDLTSSQKTNKNVSVILILAWKLFAWRHSTSGNGLVSDIILEGRGLLLYYLILERSIFLLATYPVRFVGSLVKVNLLKQGEYSGLQTWAWTFVNLYCMLWNLFTASNKYKLEMIHRYSNVQQNMLPTDTEIQVVYLQC